jgi:hypothetical protein
MTKAYLRSAVPLMHQICDKPPCNLGRLMQGLCYVTIRFITCRPFDSRIRMQAALAIPSRLVLQESLLSRISLFHST